jgi:hypothetical protein
MPKDVIDYSNTIIYKIFCNDSSVTDTYVGHTTNFVKRKYQHRMLCTRNSKLKIYDTIRKNGGWENWTMIEIGKYNCKDATEARIREQEHYDILKPTLNIIKPISSNPANVTSIDDISDECSAKIDKKKYTCPACDYFTNRKSNLDNHFNSLRHLKEINGNLLKQIKQCDHKCENCGKEYKTNAGLWKHKKTCNVQNYCQPINAVQSGTQITTELVMELIKDNKEMKQIILEQNNTINNLVKNGITNNSNNTYTNSNNKAFNLNFFLNETCKDAMNINDFVESIKVQLCDLERFGEIGYVENLSNIITTNLKALDVTERPVHCTDKKREVIYIKDDNKWEKEDDNNTRLRKAIKKIAAKNYKLLPEYREKYPGCQYADSKYSDKYNKMVVEAMCGNGNEDEKEDKIIKNISKNVVIDK